MRIWRMSFRCGNQGYEMWPHCYDLGIAAITYYPLAKTNLSKYSEGEPKKLWAQLAPAQKASLRRVAYEMRKGDRIYVKQGPRIVGRGIVKGSYKFDSKFRLVDPDNDIPWSHQVPVKWEAGFPEVDILLGAEQLTVKELSKKDLEKLKSKIDEAFGSTQEMEALEGKIHKTEVAFRSRNRALIQAKKANSDFRCEACGFSFEETYGSIGKGYIVAHHIEPISNRRNASPTTLNDIALLCANCHAMVHTNNPPILPKELRKLVRMR